MPETNTNTDRIDNPLKEDESAADVRKEFLRKKYQETVIPDISSLDTKKIHDRQFAEHRLLVVELIEHTKRQLDALREVGKSVGFREDELPESLPKKDEEQEFLGRIRARFDEEEASFEREALSKVRETLTAYGAIRTERMECLDALDELFVRLKTSGALVARRSELEEKMQSTSIEEMKEKIRVVEKNALSFQRLGNEEGKIATLREASAVFQELETVLSLQEYYRILDAEYERESRLKQRHQEKGLGVYVNENEPQLRTLMGQARDSFATKDADQIAIAMNRVHSLYNEIEMKAKKNFPLLFPESIENPTPDSLEEKVTPDRSDDFSELPEKSTEKPLDNPYENVGRKLNQLKKRFNRKS